MTDTELYRYVELKADTDEYKEVEAYFKQQKGTWVIKKVIFSLCQGIATINKDSVVHF